MKNVYLLVFTFFGILSSAFSQISSTTPGGDWSNPATWSGGVVPTGTDDVIISDGSTVIIDQDVNVLSLSVGQGVSGILQYEAINPRTVTITNDVTINAGAIFRSAVTGTITNHVLSVNGSITNNGTLDFSTNGNTAGTGIVFTGAANTNFSGSGTVTNISAITVNKGTSAASVVELSTNAFTFHSSSSTAGIIQSFLSIVNGTFKISGSFTMDNPVFTGTGTYTIPATGGLWLNNPNFTVNARAGDVTVLGTLQVDAGIYNIGTALNHRLLFQSGTVLTINGGEINVASRLTSALDFGITYTQTAGVFTVNTVGNTSGTRASFDIEEGDNSTFNMSGGTIIVQNTNSSGAGNRDYFNEATNVNITGGTVQLGNAATGSAQTYFISGWVPDLVIDNTSGGHIVNVLNDITAFGNTTINSGTTLNLDAEGTAHNYVQLGSSFTNSGTLNGSLTGSSLSFTGTSAQTYGGDGTIVTPIDNLTINNAAGLTITNTIASDITTLNLSMLSGDIITGVSTLAVGTSTSALGTVTYGSGTVAGKFKKWVDATASARDFQVGIPGTTRNVNIDFTTAPTTGGTLTAQWVSAYGGTNGLPLTEPGFPTITDVASDGYWTVTAADGFTGGVYTGTFNATNVITVIDFTQLVLVKRADNVSPWVLDGTHVPTVGSNANPILSRTGMSGFSDFGIGGSNTSLPITIEYFKGSKQGSGNVLDWKVTCTNSPTATMVLERSADGRKFSSINSITATSLRCLQPFNYNDASPNGGINYYRIRLTDADGKTTYSNIIAILNKEKGFDLVSLMPNPVRSNTVLSIASAVASKMEVVVTDISGKKVAHFTVSLVAGSNQVPLDFSNLASGTYQVTGYNDGAIKTLQFIKN